MIIDLTGCARCGGEGHPGLELREFSHPADTGRGIIFTHWAPCPTNGEPILYASGVKHPAPLEQGKELVEVDPMKAQAESMERHADEMLAILREPS